MSAFGDLLQAKIEKAPGVRGFAALIGISPSQVSLICHGKRTPPLESIESWADHLKLTGHERERFLNLAALAHLPPAIEARFVRFLDEHDRQGEQLDQLRTLVAKRLGLAIDDPALAGSPAEKKPTKPRKR